MKLIRLAYAAGVILVSGGCAPAAVSSRMPAGGMRGLVVRDVVAGVPAGGAPSEGESLVRQPDRHAADLVATGCAAAAHRARRPSPEARARFPGSESIVKLHYLQNPAATKRYGVRAADGAVLVSTRR